MIKNKVTEREGNFITILSNKWDKNPAVIPFGKVYELITSDKFREMTEKYRFNLKNGFQNDARKIKDYSSAIIPSTLCKDGHQRNNVTAYTGILMADVDDVPSEQLDGMLQKLRADSHVLLCHTTISRGLRIFFRSTNRDISLHKKAFEQGNLYFAELLGVPTDMKCSNPTRLAYLCHDPEAWYNPDAEPFEFKAPAKEAKKGRPRKFSAEKAFRAAEARLAQGELRYEPGHYNEYVSQLLYRLNRYGVTEEEALRLVTDRFTDYDSNQLASIVRSVYAHTEEFGTETLSDGPHADRHLQCSIQQMKDFVNSTYEMRYNIVKQRLEYRPANEDTSFLPVDDNTANTLWIRFLESGHYCSFTRLQALIRSEFVPLYNPFLEYFDRLAPWDGTDYIHNVSNSINAEDQALFNRLFKKWFVSMVASILNPRFVNHNILTFIGRQRIYKTTFFSNLLPPELSSYFMLKVDSSHISKDDLLSIGEMALICIEETDTMSPTELNRLKALTSAPDIKERLPYARYKTEIPHQASFCATGNNRHFLTDDTGNRRWIPFFIHSIPAPFEHPLPHEGMYAQALHLIRTGYRHVLDDEENNLLEKHNRDFEAPNLEMEFVNMFFRKPHYGELCEFVSTASILKEIHLHYRQRLSPARICHAMERMGFHYTRNGNQRGFQAVRISIEEHKKIKYTDTPDIFDQSAEEPAPE